MYCRCLPFASIGEGERRVSQVEVLDKQSNTYQPLDKAQQYMVATLDHLILELGGSGIFSCVTPDAEYYGADIEILRHYLETNLGGVIGAEYSKPQGRISFK